jgi:hypothetical protein
MIKRENYLDHSTREELYWQRIALNQITCLETTLGYTSYDDGTVDFADGFPRIPPIEEIRAKVIQLKQNAVDTKYQRDRAKEYPPIGDQLGMLWDMMNDETIPGKDSIWYQSIQDIKNKYPKPE